MSGGRIALLLGGSTAVGVGVLLITTQLRPSPDELSRSRNGVRLAERQKASVARMLERLPGQSAADKIEACVWVVSGL